MTTSFKTTFINQGKYDFQVPFESGGPRVIVPSGDQRIVINSNEYAIYAKYEKVIYKSNGDVEPKSRKGWKEPPRPWPTVEFINQDGLDVITFSVDHNKWISVPRRIPVTSTVNIFSPYVQWHRWIVAYRDVQKVHPSRPDSLITSKQLCRFGERPRSKDELERLEEMRRESMLTSVGKASGAIRW